MLMVFTRFQPLASTIRLPDLANRNLKKAFLSSVVQKSYSDRNVQITVSDSSSACTFTAQQALDFAMNWRSNPSQIYNNADDVAFNAATSAATDGTATDALELDTGNFVQHLATSDLTETVKELTSLMQLQNILAYKLNNLIQTQNFLMLITASDGIQQSQSNLKTRSLGLEKMNQDYYSASSSTASGSAVE